MDIRFSLTRLTEQDLKELHAFARANHVNLAELVETQLLAWLECMREKFSDAGPCPCCSLGGKESVLKGMPILDAEREGLISIGPRTSRHLLENTLYVVCPQCLWWGMPPAPSAD